MLKIFFASHGNLAKGMEHTLGIIFGKIPNMRTFAAYVDNHDLSTELDNFYLNEVNEDDEVLLCSDLYGGSVNQIMYRYLNHKNTRLVTGVNLAFLLEIATVENLNDKTLKEVIDHSREFLCEVRQDKTEVLDDEFF